MYRFLDPKNDFAFKRVFGTEKNKEILIRFLNDIFEGEREKIEDLEFLKLHQDPEIASMRQSIVDVACKDASGNKFIIEMQCATDTHFIQRAVAYASRTYLNQRTNDSNYGNMRPVIFFAIMKHTLFKNKAEYLSHHKLTDVYTGENDIKDLSFSFLELSKFKKKSIGDLKTNIEKWTYFFRHAQTVEPGELELLEKEGDFFRKAYNAIAEYNYTPEELLEYERYGMKEDEVNTRISDAKAEGELKKAREAALSMLSDGLSVGTINKYTGLSTEEINTLKTK
jgi:predicted transposase/invertase (TIGR01784 family)